MKIAVITGASSGLGKEFARAVNKTRKDIDCVWLVARREDKLISTAEALTIPYKILPLDITDKNCVNMLCEEIKSQKAEVQLLINNAGFGKLGEFRDISAEDNAGMVTLNCEALTYVTSRLLPFIRKGGEIINSCSIASFAPNTRMAVYSSTKAYVLSFSKALRAELKKDNINVLATCPGPMETEFFSVAGIKKGSSRTFDTLPRVNPTKMAEKSLAASRKRQGVYTNLLFYKFYRILAKLLPHSLIMKLCGT